MGDQNSSLTRVKPLMDWICEEDIENRLQKLLDCLGVKEDIHYDENTEIYYEGGGKNNKEKALQPPKQHLIWMLENGDKLSFKNSGLSADTIMKRERIRSKCNDTIEEGKRKIEKRYADRKFGIGSWFTLEGVTYVDLYIETKTHVIIIESKRTEDNTTKKINWLDHRDQFIRNMNCAYETLKVEGVNKRILAYYIVNKDRFDRYKTNLEVELYDIEYYKKSIPYLEKDEKSLQEIMNNYQGYRFWEDIIEEFKDGIAFS